MPAPDEATIDLFSDPLGGVIMMGAGLVVWMFGAAFREFSERASEIRDVSRHNPWVLLVKKRPLNKDEALVVTPNWHFTIYRTSGSALIWFGFVLGGVGAIALCIALAKKIFLQGAN